MRYLLILIMVFTNGLLHGQKTKQIVKYFNDSKQIMEEYNVLNENVNVKHGEYVNYFRANTTNNNSNNVSYTQKHGFYYQNKLDSHWTYFLNGHHLIKEEFYNKGKKIGIWKTYLENGVIKQFDYNLNKEIEPLICLNFRYPKNLVELGIEGVVEIKVVYNIDCSIDSMYVFKSLDSKLDENAIEVVNNYEKLRGKYSLLKDCISKHDTIYSINYKLQ